MLFKIFAGHTLVEALLALLIISIAWLTLQTLAQKSLSKNMTLDKQIIRLFNDKSQHENKVMSCYLNNITQCFQ
ncbi:hypothetical protein MNBD_GAMMA12-3726 [hydrothermal vent metagenome]|uniref:Uncharacterized protein n=1 Tax=hydrothermal vent metagenome TaxID=652676 RepID=A0A3B0YY74_9ZZZZ